MSKLFTKLYVNVSLMPQTIEKLTIKHSYNYHIYWGEPEQAPH